MRTSCLSCGPRLFAVVLAFAAVSCGGGSDQKETGTGATSAPASSAPLSVEWTDADLEKDASRIGYGPAPKEILARGADSTLVFTPQTPQDHIATNFTTLPSYSGERSLDLTLDVKVPGGETCLAFLQDQGYNVLGTVPCKAAGEQKSSVKVPANVTGVRVYFLSPAREPLRLPARVHLTEHR